MNIFVLDNDPVIAARYMCDKHVGKMIIESGQMMASVLRHYGATDEQMPLTATSKKPWRGGWPNHPCTRWVMESQSNFTWLWSHAMGLGMEFKKRYGKTHACVEAVDEMHTMLLFMNDYPDVGLTPFAQAMPDECKDDDAVKAYRRYYSTEKKDIAKWQRGTVAPWWMYPCEKPDLFTGLNA